MKADKQYLKLLLDGVVHKNDEQSFSKLFKLLYPRLVSFSIHYVNSRELAEEIVSDVFVKIWNNRKNCSEIIDIELYLYKAVKNQSLNNIDRSNRSFIEVSAFEELNIDSFITAFDPAKELQMRELVHNMNIAIDSLPTQCRTVFKLIKEDGFKYKEVAEILNISPRTVETQLVRALKRLGVALTPFVEEGQSKKKNSLAKSLNNIIGLFL